MQSTVRYAVKYPSQQATGAHYIITDVRKTPLLSYVYDVVACVIHVQDLILQLPKSLPALCVMPHTTMAMNQM